MKYFVAFMATIAALAIDVSAQVALKGTSSAGVIQHNVGDVFGIQFEITSSQSPADFFKSTIAIPISGLPSAYKDDLTCTFKYRLDSKDVSSTLTLTSDTTGYIPTTFSFLDKDDEESYINNFDVTCLGTTPFASAFESLTGDDNGQVIFTDVVREAPPAEFNLIVYEKDAVSLFKHVNVTAIFDPVLPQDFRIVANISSTKINELTFSLTDGLFISAALHPECDISINGSTSVKTPVSHDGATNSMTIEYAPAKPELSSYIIYCLSQSIGVVSTGDDDKKLIAGSSTSRFGLQKFETPLEVHDINTSNAIVASTISVFIVIACSLAMLF